ncbi:MAG: 50S ribosomal protein L18 [Methanomassiliicoccales archaeon]|nr:50S ribosomal protein L18 [Methanomassiliicoccales archaeon]
MATGPRYKVAFRRRREGRTDYRQRAALLRARLPRAVVRTTLRHTSVQLVEYDAQGDLVLATAHSHELLDLGWKASTGNLPAAYLTGYLAGMRAKKKGVSEAVLDIGLKEPVKGAACFATLKGLLDAGLDIPHSEEILPSQDRIKGKHINADIEKMVEEVKNRMEVD